LVRGILVLTGLLAGYAALRAATGLTAAERTYAISRTPDFAYGDAFRAIGSLGSAIALASVLTPIFAFCATFGLMARRWRVQAWLVACLALVAAFFTYTRVSLLAMVVAVVGGAVLWALLSRPSRARVALAGLATVAVLGGVVAGVVATSSVSPSASARAQGFVDPGSDASIHERLSTWHRAIDAFSAEPQGYGVGTVGGAAQSAGTTIGHGISDTTDNSFLKVLVEQGVIGAGPFALGMIALGAVAARRLLRAGSRGRGLGLAALAGYGGFVLLWLAGEYIEQPGKVIAWLLLGIALGEGFLPAVHRLGGPHA
jgi:O-antigen ligase